MSNYTKITDYAAKDLLLSGDPLKAVKGSEVGAEFDAIATMSATKTDAATLAAAGGAALVGNTAAGNIAATTVQAAINELDAEKALLAGSATQVFSVAAAVAAGNAPRADQIQSQSLTAFTTAGTSTAFTLTPTPAIAAYTAGMEFDVTFNAASGASPTLEINGIATPPNLVKQNADGTYSNLASGDFPSGWQSNVKMVSTTQALVRSLPIPISGNYTPTLFNTTNVAASTAYPTWYYRVGNVVSVFGALNIDPTATGAVVLGMSLPIASDFTGSSQAAGGFAESVNGAQIGAIYANATNDRVTFAYDATNAANILFSFNFSYAIV